MRKRLTQSFFARPTLAVARDLRGKWLVREYRGRVAAVMITEVEAYDGPHDRASHASRGMTPRTTVMFGPAGYFYVYFTYGMHWLVNVVTGDEGYPAAVLIRGVMREDGTLINGPARLTKELKIDALQNKQPVMPATGLWFEDRGTDLSDYKVKKSKRIGVDYAGELWANKLYNLKLSPKIDKQNKKL